MQQNTEPECDVLGYKFWIFCLGFENLIINVFCILILNPPYDFSGEMNHCEKKVLVK